MVLILGALPGLSIKSRNRVSSSRCLVHNQQSNPSLAFQPMHNWSSIAGILFSGPISSDEMFLNWACLNINHSISLTPKLDSLRWLNRFSLISSSSQNKLSQNKYILLQVCHITSHQFASQAFHLRVRVYDASKVEGKRIQMDWLFAASLKLSQLSDSKSYKCNPFVIV